MESPKVSIIIRTLNEEKHLGNLLRAIREQEYKSWEVIVVDSGSTDRTLEIVREFGARLIQIDKRDFTFGYALNQGCKEARGEYLVLASAHVLPIDGHWLANIIAPFSDSKVAMVYGKQRGTTSSKFSEQRDFERLFSETPANAKAPLDYANNANSAVRKSLWKEKQFDEYLFGLEDIEWVRAMTAKGLLVHYEPKAGIYHIHEETWSQVYNRYRREAIAAVRIGVTHPPQARLEWYRALWSTLWDLFDSFPNVSPQRIEEIVRFRYYQWKGSRQGWFKDRSLDLERDKYLFYPSINKAVVITGEGHAELVELEVPELRPSEILIQVSHVGVCRTDLEVYEGTLGYYREGVAHYPIVPGHEFSGTIVRIGANNKYRERFKVGQRVVGECILSRGADRKEVGVINHNGAYANLVIVPGDAVHVIPEEVSLKDAVLAEPLAVVLRALRRVSGRVTPHSKAAVIGAGPIGNLSAQVLASHGYEVTLFDKNSSRLKALSLSSSTALKELDTFSLIVEATGSREVLERVLRESATDATILLLGFPYGEMSFNFEEIVGREKVVVGSVGAEWQDFDAALKLLPTLKTQALTETILPLSEFKKGWALQRAGSHLKIILTP